MNEQTAGAAARLVARYELDFSVGRLTPAERTARGKAARAKVPRESHGVFDPPPDRTAPIGLLEQQAKSRVAELVPVRYGRMMVSPFTYYRGAALPMASDLAATPVTGLAVQACGDAHLSNFGLFGSAERGRVTMGVRDDGKPDRRHVKSKNRAKVASKVRELERQRDEGIVAKPGRPSTVEQWLNHWLENIAKPSVRYKTYVGYRTAVYKHLIPGVGAHRLDRLEPEHLEKLYARMQADGVKAGTAHQVHRTARTAFGEAFKRRRITRNPTEFAKPPRVNEEEVEPFEAEEIDRLLRLALEKRNGVRFVVALALGIRQGEALGLKWSRLDEATKTLRISKALQRRTWQHGCDDPHKCGARYHKTKPCKANCRRHQRTCPPPCPPDCVSHARWCPQRHGGGLVEADVKSKAGRRGIALPDELFILITEHRKVQKRERELAGSEWHEGHWIFAQPNGKPIDPRRDQYEWKALLEEAGVREARLHDARHTAATVLLLLGVQERAVMDMMGWSNSAMVKRYAHVTARLRRDIADRLNSYLWKGKWDPN